MQINFDGSEADSLHLENYSLRTPMKRVLLIEDNEDHAELIHRSLAKGLGSIQVTFANSAQEAYDCINKTKFDVILCDYYLPDTSGEKHIRQLSKLAPTTPLIIITGQGDEKVAARSIKAGAEDYIVKTREALAALPSILKRTLTKHQSHQSKKKREFQKYLQFQNQTLKRLLGEVEILGRKMRLLKHESRKNTKPSPAKEKTTLENISRQLDALKGYVKNMFSGRK
jgi:Response regulator containing CheY-like receiver, AAA-type ATPase, and DNA-binding domains